MLDAEDPATFAALSELYDVASSNQKNIVFWIGAGASKWGRKPGWAEMADSMHRQFSRKEINFDREKSQLFLELENYPRVFGLGKKCNKQRYNYFINEQLAAEGDSAPVYDRMINSLRKFNRIQIVTTNADELLERNLGIRVLMPTNIELASELIHSGENFIAKIHGSVSDMESLIFTDEEYSEIIKNESYIRSVLKVLESSSVVFVGYGLADDYVVKMLESSSSSSDIFGAGPHFSFVSDSSRNLPPSVRKIGYQNNIHKDHRSPIEVLEELVDLKREREDPVIRAPKARISAHMLSDVFCEGTFVGSQSCKLVDQEGRHVFMDVGQGFTAEELQPTAVRSFHDIIVGLVCFDYTFVPLAALSKTALLVGLPNFEALIKEDIIRFVRFNLSDCFSYAEEDSDVGGLFSCTSPESEEIGNSKYSLIRKHLNPIPGKEDAANEFFQLVEGNIVEVAPEHFHQTQRLVKGLLMRRSIRKKLGLSEGTPLNSLPRWLSSSLLRLSSVVRLGIACRELEIASVQFESGNDRLAGPAFTTTFSDEYSDQVASYVTVGNYNADLGNFARQNPQWLTTILQFRGSPEGISLRAEIFQRLERSEGNEIATAVNACLMRAIPTKILAAARDAFATFNIHETVAACPAIWTGVNGAPDSLETWRKNARLKYENVCRGRRKGPYDFCLCGSGEKSRFCCGEALGVIW